MRSEHDQKLISSMRCIMDREIVEANRLREENWRLRRELFEAKSALRRRQSIYTADTQPKIDRRVLQSAVDTLLSGS